jgi:sulfite oxidase
MQTFSLEEVRKHDGKGDNGVWVIREGKVYDMTSFVAVHPGGKKILMAAGKELQPFWNVYNVHDQPEVREILEGHHVGFLDEAGLKQLESEKFVFDNEFKHDPERSPLLHAISEQPFNAEVPSDLITDHFYTPQDLFYVRNHLPVPVLTPSDTSNTVPENSPEFNEDAYEIEFYDEGRGILPANPTIITLGELKRRIRANKISATIQCGGNRRKLMKDRSPELTVKGGKWTNGAISNGLWGGFYLRDVFYALLFNPNPYHTDPFPSVEALEQQFGVHHVKFEGLDGDENVKYEASIPIFKALSEGGRVMLATTVNEEKLNRDHGYPLRAIVPGYVGARNVKWLKKVTFAAEESTSPWQRKDYKSFNPDEQWEDIDWDKAKAIQATPITSSITTIVDERTNSPSDDTIVIQSEELYLPSEEDEAAAAASADAPVKKVKPFVGYDIRGYAFSGGGRGVERVDVSLDGGETWRQGSFMDGEEEQEKDSRAYSWVFWNYEIKPEDVREALLAAKAENREPRFDIVVKAVDSDYNQQPMEQKHIWNIRGLLMNEADKKTLPIRVGH